MPTKYRAAKRLILPLLASLLLASVAVGGAWTVSPQLSKEGSRYSIGGGSLQYQFDAAWRTESIWNRTPDGNWQRVVYPDPARLAGMRQLLLLRLGCTSLGEVPVEGQAEIGALKSLGYL
jgi:hypothetical protein